MALFIKQNEQRSELQSKIAADLSERLKARQIDENPLSPSMLEGQHQTRAVSILWILLLLVVIALIVYVIVSHV